MKIDPMFALRRHPKEFFALWRDPDLALAPLEHFAEPDPSAVPPFTGRARALFDLHLASRCAGMAGRPREPDGVYRAIMTGRFAEEERATIRWWFPGMQLAEAVDLMVHVGVEPFHMARAMHEVNARNPVLVRWLNQFASAAPLRAAEKPSPRPALRGRRPASSARASSAASARARRRS